MNSPQAIIVTTATTPHNSYLPHSLATARTALLAQPGNCWPPAGSSRAALLPSPAAGQQPAPRRQSRSLLKSTTQIKQRTKDGARSGLRRPQLSSSEDRSQSRGRVSFKAPAAAEEQQQRLYTTTLVHDHNGAVVVTTTTATAAAAQLRLSRPLGRQQQPAWSFEAAERSAAEQRRRRQGAFAGLRSRSEDTTTQTTTQPTALYSVQGKEYIY